jgi:hypothetical protein
MNPRLHFWLCLSTVVTGFAGAVLLGVCGGQAGALALIVISYNLGAVGHYVLLCAEEPEPRFDLALVALFWPLADLWMVAFAALPGPRMDETP